MPYFRADDSPPVWVAADDQRPLRELGLLELLDSREERIEVEVGDDRRGPCHA
jgi:hypothetical protein